MANQLKWTPEARETFIKVLRNTGNVSLAARAIGMHRRYMYDLKDADPEFALEWDDAVQEATDVLIEEARRRAARGVLEPVYYQGMVVGHIRKYSDVLLMFLIKARRKEYATERREHSGLDGKPMESKVTHDGSPELVDKLGEIFERVGAQFEPDPDA